MNIEVLEQKAEFTLAYKEHATMSTVVEVMDSGGLNAVYNHLKEGLTNNRQVCPMPPIPTVTKTFQNLTWGYFLIRVNGFDVFRKDEMQKA